MQSNAKIAVALVGGYLLGRTKKAKMAIGLGMFLAGKKISLDPRELTRLAAASPLVSGLSDQVRKDLVDGTRTALTSAVTQRANTLADTLHERTLDLNDPLRRGGREDGEEGRGTARDDGDAGADARDAEAPDGNEDDGRRRGGTRKSAPAKASKAAKPAGSAARRSAGKASSAGRSAGRSTARKTAGTARKAASGGRRKAADRGDADA